MDDLVVHAVLDGRARTEDDIKTARVYQGGTAERFPDLPAYLVPFDGLFRDFRADHHADARPRISRAGHRLRQEVCGRKGPPSFVCTAKILRACQSVFSRQHGRTALSVMRGQLSVSVLCAAFSRGPFGHLVCACAP